MTQPQRIDLRSIMQRTLSTVYQDLVTRPTGRAVRTGIEEALASQAGEDLAVIDFSTVRCLDVSCADEVVGKLLLQYGAARYFLLRGVSDAHREVIEQVLERHRLAVVAQNPDGQLRVLGPVADTAREAFAVLNERGGAAPQEVADRLRIPLDTVHRALKELVAQRLVQEVAGRYLALAPS